MKSRTVIILWIITTLLGVTTYVVKFKNPSHADQNTELTAGDILLKNLPIREVARITLRQGDQSTELLRLSDNIETPLWGVADRDNYTINYELLRNLLGTLNQIKVSQSYPCESSHYNRFGLMEESDNIHEAGLQITMFHKDGSKLGDVFLGKFNGNNQANGRFIRVAGDDSGVYSVRETFTGISASPQYWLDQTFLKVSNIKSVTLTAPNDPEFTSWKLVKKLNPDGTPTANGLITLDGMTEKEIMKIASTNPFKKLFSSTRFLDLLSEEQVAKTTNPDPKLARTAVIQTEDGITYTVNFWPQLPVADATANYLLKLTLSAEETDNPEVTDKIIAAKRIEGKIYQVSPSTIAPLQKERGDFIAVIP